MSQFFTDEDFDAIIQDLVTYEGLVPWLYCDQFGYVTTGIGNLVTNATSAVNMPLTHLDGSTGSDAEKAAAWTKVKSAYTTAKSANYYKDLSDLRISKDYATNLAKKRLENEFIPGLIKIFPSFSNFPLAAKRAIIDMAYNLGLGKLAKAFPSFIKACNISDWATAADECHRSTCRDSRNDWTQGLFQSIDA